MKTEYIATKYSGQSNKNTEFDSLNALCNYIISTPDCCGVVQIDDETILQIDKFDDGGIRLRKDGVYYEINEFSVSGMPGKFERIQKMGNWVHVNYYKPNGGYELAASASIGNYDPAKINTEFSLQIKSDLLKFAAKTLS